MARRRSNMPSKSELKRNLKQLKAELVKHPLDLDARVRAARTLRLLGKPKDAIQHYRAVARYLALAGQPLQAIAVLKELLQLEPEHEETLLFLAKLYARTRAATASNVGRIAVPIDDGHMPGVVDGAWPSTSTGVWRAIRPRSSEEMLREHSAESLGATDLDAAIEVDDADVTEAVEAINETEENSEVEEISARVLAPDPEANADAPTDPDAELPHISPLGDDFEILGEPNEREQLLPEIPLFSTLSQKAFVDLAGVMESRSARPGDTVFTMGEPGDSIFLISRGRVRAYRPSSGTNTLIESLGPGSFLGLLGFISPRGRAATVIAETELEFFEFSKTALEPVIADHPAVEKGLFRFVRHRLLMSVLAEMPVVRALGVEQREAIARRFVQRKVGVGEQLFYEGAEINTLALLMKGRVVVGREAPNGEILQPLATLEPGDLVGCLASETGADATAQVTEDTVCAVITHKVFVDLARVYSSLQRLREGLDEERCMLTDRVFSVSVGLRAERFLIDDDK